MQGSSASLLTDPVVGVALGVALVVVPSPAGGGGRGRAVACAQWGLYNSALHGYQCERPGLLSPSLLPRPAQKKALCRRAVCALPGGQWLALSHHCTSEERARAAKWSECLGMEI